VPVLAVPKLCVVVGNVEVIFDRFNVVGISISGSYSIGSVNRHIAYKY
jgi:hypothetical protein